MRFTWLNKYFWLAAALLAGTIIGAGVFSLPYIFSRLGLGAGIFYLFFFTLIYFSIHWMYVQLLKIENNQHQFFYLARKYLSSFLAKIASFIILGELIFALLAYLVLASVFNQIMFDGSLLVSLLVFWFLSSIFIFIRLKWLALADFAAIICILAIIGIVFAIGAGRDWRTPWFQKLDLTTLFLPFGPLLFSLAGRPALHKVIEVYRRAREVNKDFSLSAVTGLGTAFPAVIYLFFVISVLRLNPSVLPETLNSLNFLSPAILILLCLMGLIAIWTSYFMIGANVKDILVLDLKQNRWFSGGLVLFLPLLLYFIGFKEFLTIISFAGGVFLALESVFVVKMWQKAFPNHFLNRFRWFFYLIFGLAIIYEISVFI